MACQVVAKQERAVFAHPRLSGLVPKLSMEQPQGCIRCHTMLMIQVMSASIAAHPILTPSAAAVHTDVTLIRSFFGSRQFALWLVVRCR